MTVGCLIWSSNVFPAREKGAKYAQNVRRQCSAWEKGIVSARNAREIVSAREKSIISARN